MAFEFLKKLFCKKDEGGEQGEQAPETQSDVSGEGMNSNNEASSEEERQQ